MTPYLYLATEYTRHPGGIEAANAMACAAAAEFVRAKLPVFCPIAHCHGVAIHGGINPLDHEIWLPADAPFMDNASALVVWMTPTWETSYGIGKEIEAFDAAGKRIFKVKPGPLTAALVSDLREALESFGEVGVLGK